MCQKCTEIFIEIFLLHIYICYVSIFLTYLSLLYICIYISVICSTLLSKRRTQSHHIALRHQRQQHRAADLHKFHGTSIDIEEVLDVAETAARISQLRFIGYAGKKSYMWAIGEFRLYHDWAMGEIRVNRGWVIGELLVKKGWIMGEW